MSHDSVSQWIDGLKAGDEQAAQAVWQKYFGKVMRVARRRLTPVARRAADEEDVALSVFDSFYRDAAAGRFPQLEDRDDLWKLLFTITERKAIALAKHQRRQKRGGGKQRGESVFLHVNDLAAGGLDQAAAAREPSPQFAAEMAEQVQHLLECLEDDTLRHVAVRKMDGASHEEIAQELDCAVRTIKRKLQVIRAVWSKELG